MHSLLSYFFFEQIWGLCESHSVMSDSLWVHGLYSPWNSPGQNAAMDSLSLIQGIFPTQGSNPDLPHWEILYQLSHKGSPRILEWVAYPFSRGSSQPRNRTEISCVAGGFYTSWAMREAPYAHTLWGLCGMILQFYFVFLSFYNQVEQFFICLLAIWRSSLWSALHAVLLFYLFGVCLFITDLWGLFIYNRSLALLLAIYFVNISSPLWLVLPLN